MKAKGVVLWVLLISLFCLFADIRAQQASAELISSYLPAKLKSGEQLKDGIQNLVFKDNRLYIANIWAGLQILDVTLADKPKELGSFTTEHRTHNVFVQDTYVYLSNELGGVIVIDISNPSQLKTAAKIKTQGDAYWVVANYPFVYVAEESKGVNIYDLSDLAAPRLIGSYPTKGWAWALFLDKTNLYVAEKNSGILILDVSAPSLPAKLGQFISAKNAKAIQIENDVAYIANGPDGLWILDVSNPAFPKLISRLSVDGYVYDVHKSGSTAFLANELKHRLDIVNVADLKKPVKEGEYVALGKVYSAFKKDIYVYVAADAQSLVLRYNRPPFITPITNQTVDENKSLEILTDAYDPDDDKIVFSIDNLPKGALFDSLRGEMKWTPDYEQSGLYPKVKLTVQEKTASALSSSTTFDISVNHVNRVPSIPDVPNYSVDENRTLSFTLAEGADSDQEDKGLLTYSAGNLPEGALLDSKTRMFSWTPAFEQSGIYTIDFAVHDPQDGVARDASIITVKHIDRKPTLAAVETQSTDENMPLTFTLKGSDPDKEDQKALSYKAVNLPEGAKFDAATAIFSWTPTYDQSGLYKKVGFIFLAGEMSDSTFVDISVNHVNRQPVLEVLNDQAVDENQQLLVKIKGGDSDREDSGKLVYTAKNLPAGAVFKADSLLLRWMPTFEQSGDYENIVINIQDPSGLNDSKSFKISVNHVNRTPVLAMVEAKSIDENLPLRFELIGSDPDAEDQGKLIFSAEGLPEGASLQGKVFSWAPTYDQSGSYPLTFSLSDGRITVSQKTTITVNHVNRPPMLAEIPAQMIDENKPLTFNITASDPDKEDKGKLNLASLSLPDGAAFDPGAGEFTWTPSFEQSGMHKITFVVTDPAGLKDEKIVEVTVNHVNRTPVFAEQIAQIIDENKAFVFQVTPASDPDKEDQAKISYLAADLPSGAAFDASKLTLAWTPNFEQSGLYTINLSVTDGAFTVNQPLKITVNHINRPPQITQPLNQTVDENIAWNLKIDFSDPDKEDAGKLVLSAENVPAGASFDAANGAFNWTPTFEQSGAYNNIKMAVRDAAGLSDEKNFNITVNHVNRPPSLAAISALDGKENSMITMQLQTSDPDREDEGKLIYSAQNLPAGMLVDAKSGLVTWTPNFLQAGNFEAAFKVTDSGGLSSEQKAVFTIEDVNRPPSFTAISAKSVKENTPLSFTINAKDEDSDNTLTYSAKYLPAGASFDTVGHNFTWTPSFEQAGNYTVVFTANDGKTEVEIPLQITVENVNRPPKFVGLGDQTIDETNPLSFTAEAMDEDAETQLTYSAAALPQGALFDATSQTFNWKPTYEQAASYKVTFKVSDGLAEAAQTIQIVVKNVNRPPQITDIPDISVKEKEKAMFKVAASDEDKGAKLTYSIANLPANAKFDAGKQTFTWQPDYTQAGDYTITVQVSDGEETVSKDVRIVVLNVNREPKISGSKKEKAQAGNLLEITYQASDADNEPITFSAAGLPTGASLDAASGKFSWTPGDDQVGEFVIEVSASDGQASVSMKTTITVSARAQSAP